MIPLWVNLSLNSHLWIPRISSPPFFALPLSPVSSDTSFSLRSCTCVAFMIIGIEGISSAMEMVFDSFSSDTPRERFADAYFPWSGCSLSEQMIVIFRSISSVPNWGTRSVKKIPSLCRMWSWSNLIWLCSLYSEYIGRAQNRVSSSRVGGVLFMRSAFSNFTRKVCESTYFRALDIQDVERVDLDWTA